MKKNKKVKLILIFFLFLAVSNNSFACSCIGEKKTVKEAFKSNDAVFLGKVISKKEIAVPWDILGTETVYYFHYYKFTFRIKKIYKGKIKEETVEIITGIGHGDCGFPFELGKNYIVYSYWKNKYYETGNKVKKFLSTDICRRTTSKVIEEEAEIKQYRNRKSCKWFKL